MQKKIRGCYRCDEAHTVPFHLEWPKIPFCQAELTRCLHNTGTDVQETAKHFRERKNALSDFTLIPETSQGEYL